MKIDILVPSAGESVTEADIISWYKSSGDIVQMDEPLLGLETDKASLDLTAEVEGELEIIVPEGTVAVGDVIGKINTDNKQAAPSSDAQKEDVTPVAEAIKEEAPAQAVEKTTSYATGHPSPAAEKILTENNVSAADIKGTGKDQRITKQDAELHVKNKPAESQSESQSTPQPAAQPSQPLPQTTPGSREVRTEKMSRLRRTISERLVNAQHTAALLTTFNEIDMSAVMDIRKKYKEDFKEKYEVNLGFTSFFTKAVSKALLEFPIMNASVKDNEVHYHDFCDVGIAVATPRGLVVPIIRNAESLNFKQIEEQVVDYAKRGRAGAITPDDMDGGTFTITNGGVFGSMLSTPIINYPQSAILGLHNIVKRPVAVGDQVEIRPIMYAAVTYDHRIIDGSDAVRFLVHIKELIEDPARLLIGL